MVQKFCILPMLIGTVFGNLVPHLHHSFMLEDQFDNKNRTWLCAANEHRPENLWELYDNSTDRCYPPKRKGPCGSLYAVFVQSSINSEYGKCKCADEFSSRFSTNHLNRPLALSPDDGNCYQLYDQATCKDGEWLTLESGGSNYPQFGESYEGTCEKNPCANQDSKFTNESIDELTILKFLGFEYYTSRADFTCSDLATTYENIHPLDLNKPFWFSYGRKCFRTFTQGPCQQGQLVVFVGTNNEPKCYDLNRRISFPLFPPFTNDQGSELGSNNGFAPSTRTWLCPENENSYFEQSYGYFYDNETESCYPAFEKGPCNGTLKYWSGQGKGSEIGICRNVSPLNTFKKLNRPIAQSLKDEQIYFVYSKGDCNDGEWFVFNEKYEGVCSKNPCLNNTEIESEDVEVNKTQLIKYLGYNFHESYESFQEYEIDEFPTGHPLDIHKPFWFLHGGQCHKYFSRGPCLQGELIVFKGLNPIPTCYDPSVSYGVDRPVPAHGGGSGQSGGLDGTGDQKCHGQMHGDKCGKKPSLQFS